MSDQFIRQLIEHQGEAARQMERRFAGISDTIEVDFTQAELDLLTERIEAGGNLGRAAQDLLDAAIAEAEAKEREDAGSSATSTPESSGATGDAGAKGAGGLKKQVGQAFKDGVKAGIKQSESRT